jgi:uncharacterized protein (TIRG00374 family)
MSRRAVQTAKRVFGYLVASACLIWVFHDVHVQELRQHMARISWPWVALGIIFDTLGYLCTGLRWHLLLRPVGPIRVWRTTQAIYAGLFLNEILPLRVGEMARAFLVSRWIPAELVRVIPSMALERLSEGICLAGGIGITAIFVPLPRNLVQSADILGIVVLAATGIFVFFAIRGRKAKKEGRVSMGLRGKLLQSIASIFRRLGSGFQDIGMSPALFGAFLCTIGLLTCQAFSFWFIMRAYGIRLSFWVGAAVLLIVMFGTALPNAPANIGSYQFFCVLGLTIFGVDKTQAAGFSIVVFVLLTLPLLVIGFFALAQSGMTLSSLINKAKNLKVQA